MPSCSPLFKLVKEAHFTMFSKINIMKNKCRISGLRR